jgi:hypothetical protein
VTANAYSFLPWLRTGIATRIADDPGSASRASVPVTLRIIGEAISGPALSRDVVHQVQLYGPGDVIGIDRRAISRTEPRPFITNVEPNYLAHIEFYDEDFPWRYSPAPPDGATKRLLPWLALVVLAAGPDPADAEFTEGSPGVGPLPFVTVKDPAATLPPPAQLGAWAHVHVDGVLDDPVASDTTGAALANLAQVLRTDADRACGRLICPRHLRPATPYVAFLVPAFETGRLAGLGADPAAAPGALYSSWGPHYPNRVGEGQLPYYHRWSFTTGSTGDFEYLVRLLRPRVPDPRVGRRDVDVHRPPGPGLPGIEEPAALGGVLRLGGALQVPGRPQDEWDSWDEPFPHPFQTALARLINLAEDYRHAPAAQANAATGVPVLADRTDPVITPPLYGRWHALTDRLLDDADPNHRNWVHRLNLDPRLRIAANFGTQVIQARQEEFMAAAWEQVGDVLAGNHRIRSAQLAREVGHVLQVRHIDPPVAGAPASRARHRAVTAAPAAATGRSLTLTAPAHPRLTTTVSTTVRLAAAGGPDRLVDVAEELAVGFRVARSQVAATPLSPVMRRITRPGSRLMRRLPFTADAPAEALIPRMDAATDPVTAAPPKTVPAGVVTPAQLDAVLNPVVGLAAATAGDPVDDLPHSPDFILRDLRDPVAPTTGPTDSDEAQRFKAALHQLYDGLGTAAAVGATDPAPRLGVAPTTAAVLDALRADTTVPRHLLTAVNLPERLKPFADQFIEAMAYPVIDVAMYQALLDQSVETFVPNLDLIPANSITLLENNREFIEAYLAGLNHEMARELLWREYPTDQRGTPFRQFWDPRAAATRPLETAAERRERLYDINPMDRWPLTGALGGNGGARRDNLVLVIRGELLKKYPTAAIYAQRAAFSTEPGVTERALATIPDEAHPSPQFVRLPLYEAKIEPDVYLVGFDLGADEARGGAGDPGWFFVLKERPGDPRFGLDEGPPTRVEVWNDLTWADVDPQGHGFVEFDPGTRVELAGFDGSPDDPEKHEQRAEDVNLPLWFSGLSSADVAYILFQAPVLVAVHAQEMLP